MSERFRRYYPQDQQQSQSHGRPWQRVFLIFAILIFAVSSFYVALVVVTWADDIFLPGNEFDFGFIGTLPGTDDPPPEIGTIEDRINILVMGLDRRPWEAPDDPTRTDTVFVFTVEPYSRSAGIFSIPRDLLVDIPNGRGGFFQERMNVAYEYAPVINYPGGNAALTVDTVEENFGIQIDYYIVADFLDFIDVIDEMGGVDVNVEEPLAAWYSLDDKPENHVFMRFETGMQHMDGDRALAYVRIREGSNDLNRIKRQQQVIAAAVQQSFNVGLLPKAQSLWSEFNKSIDTDIPSSRALGLAYLAKDIPQDQIVSVSLGDAVVDCPQGGAAFLCAIPEQVEELRQQVFFDPRLRFEGAIIEIQNSSGRNGLATATLGYLAQQGLTEADMATVEGIPTPQPAQTVIFDVTGKKYTAEKVAEWLGLPKDRIQNGTSFQDLAASTTADIVIILGTDATVPVS